MQEVRHINTSEEIQNKAREASSKKAELGEDINLQEYEASADGSSPIQDINELDM
jgi:hypothetical protein